MIVTLNFSSGANLAALKMRSCFASRLCRFVMNVQLVSSLPRLGILYFTRFRLVKLSHSPDAQLNSFGSSLSILSAMYIQDSPAFRTRCVTPVANSSLVESLVMSLVLSIPHLSTHLVAHHSLSMAKLDLADPVRLASCADTPRDFGHNFPYSMCIMIRARELISARLLLGTFWHCLLKLRVTRCEGVPVYIAYFNAPVD